MEPMNGTNYVLVQKSPHNTIWVMNYAPLNTQVNSFLSVFDIWGSAGIYSHASNNEPMCVRFECPGNMLPMFETDVFRNAFNRMGVTLTFEYPFPLR